MFTIKSETRINLTHEKSNLDKNYFIFDIKAYDDEFF